MKKITFMLALLGVSATSAFAGTFTVSTDAESHVFAIKNVNNNYYCTVNGDGIGSTQNKGAVAFFKIYAGTEDGKYYLYCTTNNKYVTYSDMTGGPAKVIFTDSKDNAKQWKLKLEPNQTERYDIFPEGVNGDQGNLSWNWHGGVGNNMGFYQASDANSTWTFDAAVSNVTFKYSFGGNQFATKEGLTVLLGLDKAIAPIAVDFSSNASMTPATITEGTTEYNVVVSENLPFTKSESFDNATWYVLDMHSNDTYDSEIQSGKKNYTWLFNSADAGVTLPKQKMSEATYSDNMLWCFVGDIINGFKVYNKAAGKSLTLRKATIGNTTAVMSATDDHNLFKLYSTTSDIKNSFAIKLDGDDYYVNAQVKDGDNHKILYGYNYADGGSSIRAFAPNKFVVDAVSAYASYTPSSELPAGALGANSYLENADNRNSFKANYAAATAANYTLEQLNALVENAKGISAAAANETTIETGKYYRLYNIYFKQYLRLNANPASVLTADNGALRCESTTDKSAASVVWFTNAKAEPGRYRIIVDGMSMGKVRSGKKVNVGDDNYDSKGSYVVSRSCTKFNFKDATEGSNNNSYLHVNGGNVIGWTQDAEASQWAIVPATEVEVSLAQVNDSKYTSVYLPFDVQSIDGAKAYVGKFNDDKSALDMTKVESVPANNGFILVGDADKATLSIGNATALAETNDITGTNTGIVLTSGNNDNHASYLVFGKSETNEVGFYTPAAALTSIPANKAYINASALSSGAVKMNFGGEVTAISNATINGKNVNAPIFDLTGRRVIAPVKGGIYIQNGKKFVK